MPEQYRQRSVPSAQWPVAAALHFPHTHSPWSLAGPFDNPITSKTVSSLTFSPISPQTQPLGRARGPFWTPASLCSSREDRARGTVFQTRKPRLCPLLASGLAAEVLPGQGGQEGCRGEAGQGPEGSCRLRAPVLPPALSGTISVQARGT